ncbi:MAG: class I SAM-dependent methyltransferase, partial [Chloroflexota bacterium]
MSSSLRNCLLCDRAFRGRTFLCRDCSDYYRDREIPLDVRETFYTRLDLAYPSRSNTYGSYNEPAALLKAIERLPRNARIIEIGAGGGFLARDLADMGFSDLTLTDFTETAVDALLNRVPEADIVLTDAESLPFKDETFDVAISCDLIEHLPDPHRHLAEVARILA